MPDRNSIVFGWGKEDEQKDSRGNVQRGFRPTFLDTLNKGREISLSDDKISAIPISKTNEDNMKPDDKKVVPNGFRIQLMASSSVEKVRNEKKSIESKLDIAVYVYYDKPYYKICVGDYISHEDAEKELEKIRESGYPDAWIVSSKVFIDK